MISIIKKDEQYGDIISLKNDQIEVQVTNYGCTILKILVKDQDGIIRDVVLGHPDVETYHQKDGAYLGALVGRVANRIAKGEFELNGKKYHLAINNGPNTLHGGIEGFSYQLFDYTIQDDAVVFHYLSVDGEEGFPGNLDLQATYTLLDNGLNIKYFATSDQDTIINITNHSYFNLSGEPCDIGNHELMIHADHMACVDQDGLYNGTIKEVKGTPFDFNVPTLINDHIHLEDEQLTIGRGYDHPMIFNQDHDQVQLYCPQTGIELTVSTTLPQAQIYSANYLVGQIDKYGKEMNFRNAICIETQNMPDSIHQEENPTVILKKGEVYEESTSYIFKVRV